VQRADDSADVVRNRLKVYHDQTSPLVDYYTKKGVLRDVDGSRPVEEVFRKLCDVLER
jgi:Adenylate kinase and related kinases